jgi:hypothetical protein
MPPLTATPTNTLPDARGSLRGEGGTCCRCCLGLCDGEGLALVCDGEGLALVCEGDDLARLCERGGETDTGGITGPPAQEAPLARPSELT